MFLDRYWPKALPTALTAEWRAALIAILVALATAIAGRLLGLRRLGAAACGLGLAAGWASLSNLPAWPRGLPDRLPEFALISVPFVFVLGGGWAKRAQIPAVLAMALLGAWWLAGAPRQVPDLLQNWRTMAVLAGWIGGSCLLLAEADSWRVAAAALALWAALNAVAAPPIWTALALVPAVAVVGAWFAAGSQQALLPAAAGIGAIAGGTMAAAGLLRQGRLAPVDLVALAPLAAAWFAARILPRFRRLGGAASPAAGILALLGVVVLTYTAAALAGLR